MTGCGGDENSLITTLAPLGTWVLVILGWLVVSRDNDRRERRKELRASISQLISQIHQCEQAAHEYWILQADSEKAPALAASITRLLKSIAAARTRLQVAYALRDSHRELITFRRLVSGGDFQTGGRKSCTPGDTLLSDISDAAGDFADALELGFAEFTQKSWWSKKDKQKPKGQ